jgi:hypothetical protein
MTVDDSKDSCKLSDSSHITKRLLAWISNYSRILIQTKKKLDSFWGILHHKLGSPGEVNSEKQQASGFIKCSLGLFVNS